MEKTKFGLPVGLLAAAMCFMAFISTIPFILIVGYVLIAESNDWLKKTAVKALFIFIAFAIVAAFIGFITDGTSMLTNFLGLFNQSVNLLQINRLASIMRTGLSVIQTLVFMLLGVIALKKGNITFGLGDGILNKHM